MVFGYLLYLQDMGFILREGWRRGSRVQSTDQGTSQHTSRLASSASLRSPGAKGLEGTSLAQPDSRDDHLNCFRWFQQFWCLTTCRTPFLISVPKEIESLKKKLSIVICWVLYCHLSFLLKFSFIDRKFYVLFHNLKFQK